MDDPGLPFLVVMWATRVRNVGRFHNKEARGCVEPKPSIGVMKRRCINEMLDARAHAWPSSNRKMQVVSLQLSVVKLSELVACIASPQLHMLIVVRSKRMYR